MQDESTLGMKVPEIIDSYEDFECEVHKVYTKDGYILELHRIRNLKNLENLKNTKNSGKRRPVLLQHGILADSSNWVLNGGNQNSLGFALSLHGHDVWLANSRGNSYSKKHQKYTAESSQFWDFTWYEMSEIDLPAMVDYILKETSDSEFDKIDFVGHSQGTLTMLVALDRDSEFQKKINNFHALAPISWLTNMRSPLRYLAEAPMFERIIYRNWPMEILSSANNYTTAWLHDKFGGLSGERDVPILTALVGLNPRRYHINKMKTYLSHFTSGTSIQNIMHFAQMIKSNSITTYIKQNDKDTINKAKTFELTNIIGRQGGGSRKNSQGSDSLDNNDINFYLYVGDDDIFSSEEDVQVLENLLKSQNNSVEKIFIEDFDHLSFLWGKNVYDDLYKIILERQE